MESLVAFLEAVEAGQHAFAAEAEDAQALRRFESVVYCAQVADQNGYTDGTLIHCLEHEPFVGRPCALEVAELTPAGQAWLRLLHSHAVA